MRFFRQFSALAITAILLATPLAANAGILLEPYVGAEFDNFAADITSGGTLKYNDTGPHAGLRLGYQFPLIFVAADYDFGALNSSIDQPTGAGFKSGSVTRSSAFAEIGAKVPLLYAYVGYGFLNDWTFKQASGTNDLLFKGTAVKAGLSFTGLPFIAVTLEYMTSTFSKFATGGTETSIGTSATFKTASASTYMLTLSLPFRL